MLAAAAALVAARRRCAATITGTVTYDGKVPALKPIAVDAEPDVRQEARAPVPNEMLVLGTGNTMGNIMVCVSKGLPAGQDLAGAQGAGGHRSEGLPVQAARDGDHGRSALQDPQLRRHPPQRPRAAQGQPAVQHGDAADAQGGDRDVRQGGGHVPDQVRRAPLDAAPTSASSRIPFFAVTGTDGKFTIAGLDPGTYEIEAWHEKLGTQTATVTVGGQRHEDVRLQVRRARREVAQSRRRSRSRARVA